MFDVRANGKYARHETLCFYNRKRAGIFTVDEVTEFSGRHVYGSVYAAHGSAFLPQHLLNSVKGLPPQHSKEAKAQAACLKLFHGNDVSTAPTRVQCMRVTLLAVLPIKVVNERDQKPLLLLPESPFKLDKCAASPRAPLPLPANYAYLLPHA